MCQYFYRKIFYAGYIFESDYVKKKKKKENLTEYV